MQVVKLILSINLIFAALLVSCQNKIISNGIYESEGTGYILDGASKVQLHINGNDFKLVRYFHLNEMRIDSGQYRIEGKELILLKKFVDRRSFAEIEKHSSSPSSTNSIRKIEVLDYSSKSKLSSVPVIFNSSERGPVFSLVTDSLGQIPYVSFDSDLVDEIKISFLRYKDLIIDLTEFNSGSFSLAAQLVKSDDMSLQEVRNEELTFQIIEINKKDIIIGDDNEEYLLRRKD